MVDNRLKKFVVFIDVIVVVVSLMITSWCGDPRAVIARFRLLWGRTRNLGRREVLRVGVLHNVRIRGRLFICFPSLFKITID